MDGDGGEEEEAKRNFETARRSKKGAVVKLFCVAPFLKGPPNLCCDAEQYVLDSPTVGASQGHNTPTRESRGYGKNGPFFQHPPSNLRAGNLCLKTEAPVGRKESTGGIEFQGLNSSGNSSGRGPDHRGES